MAYIRRQGTKWEASIARKGVRKSRRFRTKNEAILWASDFERNLEEGKSITPDITFSQLLDKYMREISIKKRGYLKECNRISALQKYDICNTKIKDLSKKHFAEWRDKRSTEVSGSSVIRDMNILSHCLTIAVKEWEYLDSNPMTGMQWPKKNNARTKIITDEEERVLLLAMCYKEGEVTNIRSRVAYVFLFALETAMRAGEICGLNYEDINLKDKTAFLSQTKNGTSRTVPLSNKAITLINQVYSGTNPVFGITTRQLDSHFRIAKKECGITDIHFHDTRSKALTRLSKILDPFELAKMAGHKNLEMLIEVYYRRSMSDIAKTLD